MSTPLDLPGQLVLIRHSLSEFSAGATIVEPIVQQAMALGGINSLDALQFQKAQGASVFSSGIGSPTASKTELDALIEWIKDIKLPLPQVPTGEPIAAPGWQPPTTNASNEPIL